MESAPRKTSTKPLEASELQIKKKKKRKFRRSSRIQEGVAEDVAKGVAEDVEEDEEKMLKRGLRFKRTIEPSFLRKKKRKKIQAII